MHNNYEGNSLLTMCLTINPPSQPFTQKAHEGMVLSAGGPSFKPFRLDKSQMQTLLMVFNGIAVAQQ